MPFERQGSPVAPTADADSGSKRADARPSLLIVVCAALSVALVGFTLTSVWPALTFRADLLMWSEGDFVGNLIKLERGEPVYTPPEASNSLIYTPGAPLLTYAALRLAGQPLTIPAMRLVQLLFVTIAAAVGLACVRRIEQLIGARPPSPALAWRILSFAVLWLAATAPRVNQHVLSLHTDATALLVSMLGFWVTLGYVERPRRGHWLAMAAFPGVAFLVKQPLAAWAAALTSMLLLREPGAVRRWATFALISGLGVVAAIGFGLLLWGESFRFWVLELPGRRTSGLGLGGVAGTSLLRGVDHLLRAAPELALGVFGGALAFRGPRLARLGPLWGAWLVLVASEALSSAAGWNVLYHFGPGVVIGLCWLLAALPLLWQEGPATPPLAMFFWHRWRVALSILGIVLALRVVPSRDPLAERRFPPRGRPADLDRYLREIESTVAGHPLDRVLLDAGNWIYLPERVLVGDRAVALADQPYSGIYRNFDGLLQRLRAQHYEIVLARNVHQPNFLYDWHDWPRSSGVRDTLLASYEEALVIAAVEQPLVPFAQRELVGPMSVFVPRRSTER